MSAKKPTLAGLQKQIADLTEALKRERADSINIRARHDQQIADLKGTVKTHIIRDLLPAIDNLERALSHTPKDLKDHDYVKGVAGVAKQFEKVFADLEVKRIKTVGEPFDPHLHEAVSVEAGSGDKEIITAELQPGYTLGDEVLRHAMVRLRATNYERKGNQCW